MPIPQQQFRGSYRDLKNLVQLQPGGGGMTTCRERGGICWTKLNKVYLG